MFITPSYTAPSAIPFGKSLIESADVNTSNATQDTYIGNLDDQRALAVVTSNTALIANRDVFTPVDCSGGNVTVTLPDAATHSRQAIVVKKVDASYPNTAGTQGRVIIQRAGSDTIENIDSPLLSPSATSYTLYEPDEYVVLYPVSTAWRVIGKYQPCKVGFSVYNSAAQNIPSSAGVVAFNVENYDYGGYFALASNDRFTPLIPGLYLFTSNIVVVSGSSSNITISFWRNGGEQQKIYRNSTSTSTEGGSGVYQTYMNGSTDYVDLRGGATVSRQIASGEVNCSLTGQLIRRT